MDNGDFCIVFVRAPRLLGLRKQGGEKRQQKKVYIQKSSSNFPKPNKQEAMAWKCTAVSSLVMASDDFV